MAGISEIEWTDVTWNPVAGCTLASAGCTNCYAMRMAARLEAMGHGKYKGTTRKSGGRYVWTGRINVDYSSLSAPLEWRRPKQIFVNSMSDLFHEKVSDEFIQEVWHVMAECPQHHFQVLTKRPDRMLSMVRTGQLTVMQNVWLGTSIESQEVAERVEHLAAIAGATLFVSFEPLIGRVVDIDLIGADGVLGADELQYLAWARQHHPCTAWPRTCSRSDPPGTSTCSRCFCSSAC